MRIGDVARVAAIVLCAVYALSARAHAQAPSKDSIAAALLAKHRAYVGWQLGDGTLRSMRIEGEVIDGGITTEKLVELSEGLVYRINYALVTRGDLSEASGYTGNLFWRSNVNGFTAPIYGDYSKYLASLFMLLHEGTTELPASFVRETTVGGKSVAIVRVTLNNGDPIDCYVDPQTGAYVSATIDLGGSYETTVHILGYRDVLPGKRMIATYRVGNGSAIYRYDSFTPNVAIGNDELHPPSARAFWSFAGTPPSPIMATRTRILIDAVVNGVKGRFILDTGASAIVLDEAFAQRAGVELLRGNAEVQTIRGPVPTRVRRVKTLTIGGATLHDAFVYSEDFRAHDYRGLDRAGYDGLLGYDLFGGAIVKLGIYDSTVDIMDPSTTLGGKLGFPLAVDLAQGIPAIPMVLNTTVPVNALLDTGSPGVALLSYDLARKYHIKLGTPVCGNIDTLRIGPVTYSGEAACLWSFGKNNMLLGYDFLKHFDYVFDYPHGRMYMLPNKN